MNKTELIAAVAAKAELSKKDAEKALNATIDTITAALVEGEKVQLVGFGSFETKTREARTGRNPRTGENIEIAASRTPAFKAGKALKDKVAKESFCLQSLLRMMRQRLFDVRRDCLGGNTNGRLCKHSRRPPPAAV